MSATGSIFDRIQDNMDYLGKVMERVKHGEMPGIMPFDDIIAMCEMIENASPEASWALREEITQMLAYLDKLVASLKEYERVLANEERGGNDD